MPERGFEPMLPHNVVVNERNKERIVFREGESSEDVLAFDLILGVGGGPCEGHFHTAQREIFRCVSGELTVQMPDGARRLRPGEELDVPPGVVHAPSNESEEETVCRVEFRPAGRMKDFIRVSSCIEHKLGRQAGLFDLAPFLLDVGLYVAGPPRWLQRGLFAILRLVANLLGRKKAAEQATRERYGHPFAW